MRDHLLKKLTALGLIAAVGLAGIALYRSGRLQFNRPSSGRYTTIGIDVSHHQGRVDWDRVAAAGIDFAFIKATEGGDLVDPQFHVNWQGARSAGIRRGAYHFFTFCRAGREQALHFLSQVPPSPEVLPPVADVEFSGNCKSWTDLGDVAAQLEQFLEVVEMAWRIKPILYVTRDSLERVVGERFPGTPIWIRSVFWEPRLESYRGWLIWQFSDNSRIPGIRGPVDRNALRPAIELDDLRVPVERSEPTVRPEER